MAYQFTKDLETGHAMIDAEHRQLIDAINRLMEACASGQGRAALAQTLDFLEQYTAKHFADEERLQQQIHYPDYTRHKKLHDDFKNVVHQLVARLKAEGPTVALVGQVNTSIGGWLVNHIKREDTKVAACARSAS